MGNYLFSIDIVSEEVTVSESPKGSNQINFVESVSRKKNEILYNSILTLTSITKSPDFDLTIFKSMDKVCQLVYKKHVGKN